MKRATESRVRGAGVAAIGAVVQALPDGSTSERIMALFCAAKALGQSSGLDPHGLHQAFGIFLEGEE
ncbi:hypothetical protein HYN69_10500 [Gemmobacter aquarius]|uniref:Uncharacterized protein n=1 Tax=Paragemmobacter aquarius TaxID=2169400 RepID=A0A2S0UM47_9RHOB|nr:hypothetical protein [Gemmobacter aquarius]AWB48873.1 hypothetical protein HYN69_10500 [Gemmobacter aquarius]